jgi:hypothetical protein
MMKIKKSKIVLDNKYDLKYNKELQNSEIIFTPLTKEEVEAGRCSAYEYLF